MTDFAKVFNIYPTETNAEDENVESEQVKRANASTLRFEDYPFEKTMKISFRY